MFIKTVEQRKMKRKKSLVSYWYIKQEPADKTLYA